MSISTPLPELWGSPKQIKWATTIRQDMLPVWKVSMKPDDYAIVASARDSSWWIANKDCYGYMPKMPTTAQCGEPPVRSSPKPYTLDEGKTYQPRGSGAAPPAPPQPLRSGVVSAPTHEDWENATRVEPQRYGPVPGVTPTFQRQKAAGNLTAFINHINGANHLANALMLAISAKLGDPSIKAEAEAAVQRIKESVAAIEDILKGTPRTLCEVFTEEERTSGGSGLPDPDSV